MADLKISQLSAATALDGTEVAPVVQSGSTKKATIDQILAPASGKGIDFSAAGGNVLKMYDEGTWVPVVTSQNGSITTYSASGYYTRIGNCVSVEMYLYFANTGTASGYAQVTLPFSVANVCAGVGRESATVGCIILGQNSGNNMRMWDGRTASANFFVGGNGTEVSFSATYLTT